VHGDCGACYDKLQDRTKSEVTSLIKYGRKNESGGQSEMSSALAVSKGEKWSILSELRR
jgi:hypothetical protein